MATIAHLPSAVQFHEHTLSIIDRNGQPWLAATDLANALGYANPRAVTGIYDKNSDEFSTGMSEVLETSTSGNLRRQQRIFSPRGAHLVAMFARTPNAASFRRWVLDVLDGMTASPSNPLDIAGEMRAAACMALNNYVAACDGALKDAGLQYPQFADGITDEMVTAMIRQRLERTRMLLWVDEGGIKLKTIPEDACVMNPQRYVEYLRSPEGAFADTAELAGLAASISQHLASRLSGRKQNLSYGGSK